MKEKSLILGASFNLTKTDCQIVKEKRKLYSNNRKHLPDGKSMGCIFKNNEYTVGKIVEECGLKGMRVGGAVVSDKHANFIINDNNATRQDVISLINIIKNTVLAKKGIALQEEIQYIP